MALARNRVELRRAAFAQAHGSLNLIPLVDILTAIVFFSLLSVVGLRSSLVGFDLTQLPSAAKVTEGTTVAPSIVPQVVVRVDRDRFVIRHDNGETTIDRLQGPGDVSLATLHQTLASVTSTSGRRAQITVVPSDDVSYDDVVGVLEQAYRVDASGVTLGTRARQ